MARNGSGSYTLSDTLTNGTSGDADEVNAILQDIATEITNSVAVDGQSTMTGALKVSNGSAAAPAIVPGSDTDTGFYRIGANNIGAAANGALVWDWSTAGITLASGKVFGGTDIVDSTQIKANAVTLAKLATQADGTLLANLSGGTAVPSAVSLSSLLDKLGTTNGSLIYRNAAGWSALTPSTAGYVLTTQNTDPPQWVSAESVALPSQSSKSDYLLTTNGTSASWSGNSTVRARCTFSGGGSPAVAAGSVNVSGVVRNSAGVYTISFTSALASSNYQVFVTAEDSTFIGYITCNAGNKATGSFSIFCRHSNGTAVDSNNYDVIVFGGF